MFFFQFTKGQHQLLYHIESYHWAAEGTFPTGKVFVWNMQWRGAITSTTHTPLLLTHAHILVLTHNCDYKILAHIKY